MPVRVTDLLDLVCRRTGLTREQLQSQTRERHVVEARALVYYLARAHTRLGWRAIARYSTGQDASGVRVSYRRLLKRMSEDPGLAVDVTDLERACGGGAR